MNIPLLLLFCALALLHLAACMAGRKKARMATKPLLLPALAAFYWCSLPAGAAVPAVLAALCFGLVGDVLLMLPRPAAPGGRIDPLLLGGMGAFLLGHVCYIAAFWGAGSVPPPWALLAAGAACASALAAILRALWAHMGPMRLPGTVYLLALLGMAFCALASGLGDPAVRWRLVGGPLFVISDYILARSILLGPGRYTDLRVMLTYAAAQLCLVLSFL